MFELCETLGVIHPDYLEERLTRRQLNEWLAFHALSPIGQRRADTRAAVMTAHIRAALIEGEDELPGTFRPQFAIYNDDSETDEDDADIVTRQRREASQFA